MNFPRFHVFVDAECPALTSGRITSLVAPSKLVAMLSPQSTQYAPLGSESSKILRSWHTRHEDTAPEVQIVIEGELMSGLLLGLGGHIKGIYRFADADALSRADLFAELDAHFDDFSCAVSQASDVFDNIVATLERIDPDGEGLDSSVSAEAEAQLSGGHSAIAEAMDRIAQRLSRGFSSVLVDQKQAA